MDAMPEPPNPFVADAAGGGYQLPSLQDLFFLPGDWAIYLISTYAPSVATTLGLRASDYGSAYSGFAALLSWIAISILLIMVCAAIRNFDLAVTRGVVELVSDVRRRVRMGIALAAYRRRMSGVRKEPTIGAETSALGPDSRPSSASHLYE
jgi:hypothetical protein